MIRRINILIQYNFFDSKANVQNLDNPNKRQKYYYYYFYYRKKPRGKNDVGDVLVREKSRIPPRACILPTE